MRCKQIGMFLLGTMLVVGVVKGSPECPNKSKACSDDLATGPSGNGACCRAKLNGDSPSAGNAGEEEPGGSKPVSSGASCGRYYNFNEVTNQTCIVVGGDCGGTAAGPC